MKESPMPYTIERSGNVVTFVCDDTSRMACSDETWPVAMRALLERCDRLTARAAALEKAIREAFETVLKEKSDA